MPVAGNGQRAYALNNDKEAVYNYNYNKDSEE